jgi:hypothetical protein
LTRGVTPALRRGRITRLLLTALVALGAVLLLLLSLGPGRAEARFALGLQDDGFGPRAASAAQTAAAWAAERAIDGSYVRIALTWGQVVRGNNLSKPLAGFNQADPASPDYNWSGVDDAVRSAVARGKKIIFVIAEAPRWAVGPGSPGPNVGGGAWNPDPSMFSQFVHAAALRYSGRYPDPQKPGASLPRVKYWEPWNEPNIPGFFSAPDPVSAYRTLLDRAYAALKAVHSDNLVLLGGLAPVKPFPNSFTPLDFAARVLCLRRVGTHFRADPSCHQRTRFDLLAIHTYVLGATPTKHAAIPGDVFPADMPEVQNLVRTENRVHGGNHQAWVTEFAWYTNPPNSQLGDSDATAARYVAYSMYEIWKSGVSNVIWLGAVDLPPSDPDMGHGLYFAPGKPKLVLQAFSFPVIASVKGGQGLVWGRAPVSRSVRVVVQRSVGGRWRAVAGTRSGSDGVFLARFGARGNGVYRATVAGGPVSLPYNSRPIPPIMTRQIKFG